MKLNRVLVVYKPLHEKNHARAFQHVVSVVRSMGLSCRAIERSRLRRSPPAGGIRKTDLIVTVGGDGTVLAAAHMAGNVPILGFNSLPKTSVGHFCATTTKNFRVTLQQILRGKKRVTLLPLLAVRVNGRALPFPALNDLLFTSHSPAHSICYRLRAGEKKESQRSSGLWITAGPGSTAGYHSAGGKPFTITSRSIHFLVREPCPFPSEKYQLLKGSIGPREQLKIVCKGDRGTLYLDGPSHIQTIRPKKTITVAFHPQSLKIYL